MHLGKPNHSESLVAFRARSKTHHHQTRYPSAPHVHKLPSLDLINLCHHRSRWLQLPHTIEQTVIRCEIYIRYIKDYYLAKHYYMCAAYYYIAVK